MSQLLEAGDIQAVIGADLPNSMRRSPHVKRLFPDFRAEEKAYYRRTRIFPIMHLVVLRRELHERHPFVATSLFDALDESKSLAQRRMRYLGALRNMLPWLRPSSTRSTRCSAAIPGRTASKRTGRRWRRWCNICRTST